MTNVALLGTGLMGSGMARSMTRAGLAVTVWNRTAAKARSLADAGCAVADDPASAVRGADVVVTMLFDGPSVEQVMRRALPAMDPGAVWAQCATVGLEDTDRLARQAERHGVAFLDSPVLGTRRPAEEGKLTVLASGPSAVRDRVAPVFDAVGARTMWVSDRPGDGHRIKLTANAWVLAVTAGTGQSIGLARSLGLDPHLFLQLIAGGALDCGYAQIKGEAMIKGDFTPPSFTLDGAAKDAGLIAEAMRSAGCDDRVMRALRGVFEAGAPEQRDEEDMAAVVRAFTGTAGL
jgi:3-hydroxyisobutyrate dehydrogenase